MSLDVRSLKRVLSLRLLVEGGSGWAFRELIDLVEELLEERLPLILNSVLEPLNLEASVLRDYGCRLYPSDPHCRELVVVGIYEREDEKPLLYAVYWLARGENTLEFRLLRLVDAESLLEITGES
ncbi:MAG: hypothetical protein ACO2OR_02460 [Desulfurococcaceae archaeon]